MADITIGSFDLVEGWPYGSHDWKDGMDLNLLKMSVLLHPSVVSRTTEIPGSAPQNTCYIVPANASQRPNQIVVYDGGDRKFITPKVGALVSVEDQEEIVHWNGFSWVTAFDFNFVPAPVERSINGYFPGLLAPNSTIFMDIPTVKTRLPAVLEGSVFHVESRPSANVTLPLDPGGSVTFSPGSDFGSINWPSDVTLFPVESGIEDFSGQVFRIRTPSELHGLGGLTFSINCELVD